MEDIKRKPVSPKSLRGVVGMLIGMGAGGIAAWPLGMPQLLGFGMFTGAVIGICSDPVVPKRSRLALGVFALGLAVLIAVAYLRRGV